MVKVSYPEKLKNLYTEDCLLLRELFNNKMLKYGNEKLFSTGINLPEYLAEYLKGTCKNILIPFEDVLKQLSNPFDIIANSIYNENNEKRGTCSVLLEDHAYGAKTEESVGKTGIFLNLLDVEVPYDAISEDKMNILSSKNTELLFKLLSSDMIYCRS